MSSRPLCHCVRLCVEKSTIGIPAVDPELPAPSVGFHLGRRGLTQLDRRTGLVKWAAEICQAKQLGEPSIIPQNASDLSMMLFPKHTTAQKQPQLPSLRRTKPTTDPATAHLPTFGSSEPERRQPWLPHSCPKMATHCESNHTVHQHTAEGTPHRAITLPSSPPPALA